MICKYCGNDISYKRKGSKFCNLHCSNRFFNEQRVKNGCSEEHKRKVSNAKKGKPLSEQNKLNISKSLKGKKRPPLSEKHKKKISDSCKGKAGGYRQNGGRGKKGWYKNYWCDSSWELAFVIYNLDHNIKFQRNTQKFEYEFEGKKLNYIPDFIMEDGSYVEIKGYETEQTKAKFNQFPYLLEVISGRNGIKTYLDYVIKKYGIDFVKLYNVGP